MKTLNAKTVRTEGPLSLIVAVLVLATWAPADAQDRATSFEELVGFARVGDTVTVTKADGEHIKGTLSRLSPSALTITSQGREFDLRESDVTTIRQRRRDSLVNGLVIGAASGAGAGGLIYGLMGAIETEDDLTAAGGALVGTALYGAVGAGVGVLIDALRNREYLIYQRPGVSPPKVAIAPMVGNRWGVLVSLRR